MSEDRAQQLAHIADEIKGCTACALHTGRSQTVPGYGDPHADIMFIGEAPGFHEDQQGLPFVGRSGKYLDYLLEQIGYQREQVFIANVVKCRPPNNRDPQTDEIDTCNPFLRRQIELIDPLVIATLGRFSMNMFFPGAKISQIHGQPKYDEQRAYYPFYHPAAALRNPGLRHDMEADMARLLDVLEEARARRQGQTTTPQDQPDNDEPPDDNEPPKQLSLF